jgi:L-threonylcarbamoyladenylate synthase
MVQKHVKNLTLLQKKHLKNAEPTTVILNDIQNLPNSILAKDQTLAFRIVKHPLIVELIKKLGQPIVSTSANLSGESSARKFEELSPSILDRVDYTLNLPSSFTPTFKPSKIVKIIGEKVEIIRA